MGCDRIKANRQWRQLPLCSGGLSSFQPRGEGYLWRGSYTMRLMWHAKLWRRWQKTYGSRKCPGPAAQGGEYSEAANPGTANQEVSRVWHKAQLTLEQMKTIGQSFKKLYFS